MDRDPNGKFEIFGVGDLVTIVQRPFNTRDHGIITKINSRPNREGIRYATVKMRWTGTLRKIPTWYLTKEWQPLFSET